MKSTRKIRYDILRSCIDKKSHTLQSADNIVTNHLKNGVLFYYYHCQMCSGYHLTSKQPSKKAERIFKEAIL